ncbi:hypothetical protein N478_11055 [Pseudoalteromonas luteoviolacea S4060-1]|uniref:Uncharacterized protein n=1 Tax=Pseudoalteromonas luteoviolacea S4060-1 TaxID=1365257 RepID=A0A167P874_9GAMM|nr:hypothetical protein N478_11055 [Pseudoalteromonas luteoviolacea S4060-1]
MYIEHKGMMCSFNYNLFLLLISIFDIQESSSLICFAMPPLGNK